MRLLPHTLLGPAFMALALFVHGDEAPRSPFEGSGARPPQNNIPTTPVPTKPTAPINPISNEIEMRGYFKLGEVYYFSIHQKNVSPGSKSKKSEWVQIGDKAFGEYSAKDFNPKTATLTMARSGQMQTEIISLHESQWERKPSKGPKNKSRVPSPLSKPSKSRPSSGISRSSGKMSPKPKYTPPPPPVLTRAYRAQGGSSSPNSRVADPTTGSQASSSGYVSRAYLPSRFTNSPVATTSPVSPTGSPPPPALPEGSGVPVNGSSPLQLDPQVGVDPATGEIDLLSLPPPPPPPNILPPGPPPDIEPALEDR